MPDPMSVERRRCGVPCLTHTHTCDRSPLHIGVHRDVQQKGNHTCEWDDPGPKDVGVLSAEVGRLRTRVAELEEEDFDTEATVWHDEFQRTKEELAAFVPPGTLGPGEMPALCPTCTKVLCVPGLPGCARCVAAEVKRLRGQGDELRATAHGLGRDYRQARAELAEARAGRAAAKLDRIADWDGDLAWVVRQRDRYHLAWASARDRARGWRQALALEIKARRQVEREVERLRAEHARHAGPDDTTEESSRG